MEQALWKQVADDLLSQIERGHFREGERIPSEVELADRYGVSRQTVHRALAQLKSEGRVQRRRRHGTVISDLRPTPARSVRLILDYANDFPQLDLVRGIQSALGDDDRLILCDAAGDPKREGEQLLRAREAGSAILIYPISDENNTPLLREIVDDGLPVVCVDRCPDGISVDAVVSDNLEVTLRAIRTMTGAGHRRIAFLSGDNPEVSTVQERHDAYLRALSEVATDCSDLERWFAKSMEAKPQRLVRAMSDALYTMLNQPNPPTAAFCVQDCYAFAALEALDQLGVPPGAFEIATFNDWPAMTMRRSDELHRIVQRPFEIGRIAAERILARLDGDTSPPQTLVIPAAFHPAARAGGATRSH